MGLVITQAVPTIQRQNITKETIKSFLFYQFRVLHANTNLEELALQDRGHAKFLFVDYISRKRPL